MFTVTAVKILKKRRTSGTRWKQTFEDICLDLSKIPFQTKLATASTVERHFSWNTDGSRRPLLLWQRPLKEPPFFGHLETFLGRTDWPCNNALTSMVSAGAQPVRWHKLLGSNASNWFKLSLISHDSHEDRLPSYTLRILSTHSMHTSTIARHTHEDTWAQLPHGVGTPRETTKIQNGSRK